jgi:hypothetical protein
MARTSPNVRARERLRKSRRPDGQNKADDCMFDHASASDRVSRSPLCGNRELQKENRPASTLMTSTATRNAPIWAPVPRTAGQGAPLRRASPTMLTEPSFSATCVQQSAPVPRRALRPSRGPTSYLESLRVRAQQCTHRPA